MARSRRRRVRHHDLRRLVQPPPPPRRDHRRRHLHHTGRSRGRLLPSHHRRPPRPSPNSPSSHATRGGSRLPSRTQRGSRGLNGRGCERVGGLGRPQAWVAGRSRLPVCLLVTQRNRGGEEGRRGSRRVHVGGWGSFKHAGSGTSLSRSSPGAGSGSVDVGEGERDTPPPERSTPPARTSSSATQRTGSSFQTGP